MHWKDIESKASQLHSADGKSWLTGGSGLSQLDPQVGQRASLMTPGSEVDHFNPNNQEDSSLIQTPTFLLHNPMKYGFQVS